MSNHLVQCVHMSLVQRSLQQKWFTCHKVFSDFSYCSFSTLCSLFICSIVFRLFSSSKDQRVRSYRMWVCQEFHNFSKANWLQFWSLKETKNPENNQILYPNSTWWNLVWLVWSGSGVCPIETCERWCWPVDWGLHFIPEASQFLRLSKAARQIRLRLYKGDLESTSRRPTSSSAMMCATTGTLIAKFCWWLTDCKVWVAIVQTAEFTRFVNEVMTQDVSNASVQ